MKRSLIKEGLIGMLLGITWVALDWAFEKIWKES